LRHDGATLFFDEARSAIIGTEQGQGPGRNPLFDSVLEGSTQFEPELRLLDGESSAYQRDLRRAACAVVYVRRPEREFSEWYSGLKNEPLCDGGGAFNRALLPKTEHQQVDGIFLRDPESLLFKEWARSDTENSSMGQGFLFTAIAYSGGRREAAGANTTDYYFALDPERAGHLHLHNVWARLQYAEVHALAAQRLTDEQLLEKRTEWAAHDQQKTISPRPGFEGYAAGRYRQYFFDPWFDGSNYECTIIATPNWGTMLPSGTAADLRDDPVVRMVREELESALYVSDVSVYDFPHHPQALVAAAVPRVWELPLLRTAARCRDTVVGRQYRRPDRADAVGIAPSGAA
jgi:hypothetical protein